jgi:hypothetical protein
MTVVGTLKDGRTVAKATLTQVVGAGVVYLTVTITELQTIDAVLEVHTVSTDPKTYAYGPEHVTVAGNVVGFTLREVGAGTTLTAEVVALGF